MDHFVALARLPEGLRFPDDLSDRLRYDAERQRLVFRGFMSKSTFDRLCGLSPDWSFKMAMEDLFRQCTPEPGPEERPRGLRRLFGGLASPRA